MKTNRMTRHTSLKAKEIRLTAPNSWEQLSQSQLLYVLSTMVLFQDKTQIKTYLFIRLSGIKVHSRTMDGWKVSVLQGKERKVFYLSADDVTSLLHQFDFIESYETFNTRLDTIYDKYHAVDLLLHDVSFEDYLSAEKYYQLYLNDPSPRYMARLIRYLYRAQDGGKPEILNPKKEILLNCFMWFSYVKSEFSKSFTHFFKPLKRNAADEDNEFDILGSMNAQIRALTGGDVTKESEVLNLPCWRALTELDAKAKEAQEMEKINKKMKHA